MGLKDLSKSATGGSSDEMIALSFINGAAVTAAPPSKTRPVAAPNFRRTTFSLDDEVNQLIDELSLTPRSFRMSRSEVVRAGILALKAMSRMELIEFLTVALKDRSNA